MADGKAKSSIFKTTGQYLVYLLFRALELVLGLLPLPCCALIGGSAGWLAYVLFPSYRKLARENLQIAFGREKDAKWIQQTARQHFISLGSNFLCGLKLPLMSQEAIAKRVTVEGQEHGEAMVAAGKPLLFAVCHLSCWELLTQVPSLFSFGAMPSSIYQPLANPFLDAHVRRSREKRGYKLFDRTEGFAGPIKHLRAQAGAVGVLVDQHAGDKGVWCPFFDRLASTTSLPALMSMRCEAPLLPIAIYDDVGLARWRMVCYPPVNSQESKPTAEGITAMLNIAVEVMVRRAPHNWFWVHNRWKTPRPDFLLSQYRRGVVYPTGYDPRRLQPFKLLVRSPNWLGDACMAFPAVRALKAGRPDLQLTILTPGKIANLWKSLPEVDAVIGKENKEGVRSVARKVNQAGPFDAAILCTNSTRSTLELWWAGIPRLVGYHGSLRSKLLHQIVPEPKEVGPPAHHAERYLRLASYCGAKVETASKSAPAMPATSASSAVIGICAGAEYGQAKRWPMERFAEVATRLSLRWPQVEWCLFGAPGEKAMGEKLSNLMPQASHRNLVGATGLTELIFQIKSCRLLLTNDTGTMHLAAALGVPTVSIFGSTEPILTGPLGVHHRIVRHHVPCSPCFKRECPFGHYDCMTGVSVERVEAEIMRALGVF
jgi:heptosyltransferase II